MKPSLSFNVTQTHWYDRLMPFRKRKPGTLCDAHVCNGGDPFTTNYSFFEWTVDTIKVANAGSSGIRYDGTLLTFCDVTSVYFDGDLYAWRADLTVITTCKEPGSFEVTAKTSFSMGSLPGVYSPILGTVRWTKLGLDDMRGRILDGVMRAATQDIGNRAYAALLTSNHTSPIALSLRAEFPFCPMSLGPQASCSTQVPNVTITDVATVYSNSTPYFYSNEYPIDPDFNPWLLDDDLQLPVLNMFQAIYAAVRIDLGNQSPNNFILNRDVTNATLATTFPATKWISADWSLSQLANRWNHPDPLFLAPYLPVTIGGPANIQVVYPCRFQQLKSPGSLFISVLVATLSMFSGGWAVFMTIASAVARRKDPSANRCDGHCSRHRTMPEPSWFDTFDPYAYPLEEPHKYQPISAATSLTQRYQ